MPTVFSAWSDEAIADAIQYLIDDRWLSIRDDIKWKIAELPPLARIASVDVEQAVLRFNRVTGSLDPSGIHFEIRIPPFLGEGIDIEFNTVFFQYNEDGPSDLILGAAPQATTEVTPLFFREGKTLAASTGKQCKAAPLFAGKPFEHEASSWMSYEVMAAFRETRQVCHAAELAVAECSTWLPTPDHIDSYLRSLQPQEVL